MKKFCLFCVLWLSVSAFAQHGVIDIQTDMDSTAIEQYAIDTLESYQVGPGIVYTRFNITGASKTRHCYIYEVDLKNPYNAIEECHSTTMGNTELMTATHARLDSAGHRSIGSVNCNFWFVGSTDEGGKNNLLGVGATGQVRNGKIGASITGWNVAYNDVRQSVGYLMVDDRKRAFVDQYSWNASARIGENTYPISETNRNRNNPSDNELALFNSDLGTKTTLTKSAIETRLGKTLEFLEVVVKMQDEWAVNKELTAEVVSTNNTGGTKIEDGYAVLRGIGTGLEFLQGLKEGDSVHINIGIYNSLTGETPNIMQLTAGNCLVMKGGRLTPRNWNEVYNNQNYPRTGFATNATHDKVWLLVMEKPGMFTYEMCSIFRHFGATEAGGADGGGSAQFNLGGKILNPTTEGTPRAVSNCIMLFSTAPDDAVVTEMRSPATFLRLPKYAMLRLTFLGYNQYGMLVDKDLQDVVLSCDKETGYITDDGQFVCLGSGVLTAKYGKAELPIQVVLADDAEVSLRLDSVLVSDKDAYSIEINGTVDEKEFHVLPGAFEWEVEDKAVCSVSEDGVLTGLSNGRTTITGTLGETVLKMVVRVEVPTTNPLAWENMIDIDERWEVKATSSSWKTDFQTNTEGKAVMYINYTSGGRQPSIKLTADTLLYATPKALELRFAPQGSLIEKVTIGVRANNETKTHLVGFTQITPDEPNTLRVDFNETFEGQNNDIAIYPVTLEFITFAINTKAEKKEYHIPFDGIYLIYGDEDTAIGYTPAQSAGATRKVLINGQLVIINNGHIYNLLGHEITY